MTPELAIALSDLPPAADLAMKITIVLAVCHLLHLLLARANPRWRVVMWRAGIVTALLLPAATLVMPAIELRVAPAASVPPRTVEHNLGPITFVSGAIPMTPAPAAQTAVAPASSGFSAQAIPAPLAIGTIWALPFLLLAARLLRGYADIRRMCASSTPAGAEWHEAATDVARVLELRSTPAVRVSDRIATPILCRIRRPVVLLPPGISSGQPASKRIAVLAHEMAHQKSGDLPWFFLFGMLRAAFWFHPLLWFAPRMHERVCEEVADTIAAEATGTRETYARALAQVALDAIGSPRIEGAIPMAARAEVCKRIARLGATFGSKALRRRAVVAFVFTLVGSGAVFGCVRIARAQTEVASEEKAPESIERTDVEGERKTVLVPVSEMRPWLEWMGFLVDRKSPHRSIIVAIQSLDIEDDGIDYAYSSAEDAVAISGDGHDVDRVAGLLAGSAMIPDPFAAASPGSSDPFMGGMGMQSDPFAAGSPGASDPFIGGAAMQSNPFAAGSPGASDAFIGGAAMRSDPFASPSSVAADGFMGNSSPNPFASFPQVPGLSFRTNAPVSPVAEGGFWNQPVTLSLQNVTVREVTREITRLFDVRFAVAAPKTESHFFDRTMTIEAADMQLLDVVDLIAKAGGAERTSYSSFEGKPLVVFMGIASLSPPRTLDEILASPVALLDFEDEPLDRVLKSIAVQNGLNIIISRDMIGDARRQMKDCSVTMRLSGVSVSQALTSVLDTYGFAWTGQETGIIRIVTKAEAEERDRLQGTAYDVQTDSEIGIGDILVRVARVNGNDIQDANDDDVELLVRYPEGSDDVTIGEFRQEFVANGHVLIVAEDIRPSADTAGEGRARLRIFESETSGKRAEPSRE